VTVRRSSSISSSAGAAAMTMTLTRADVAVAVVTIPEAAAASLENNNQELQILQSLSRRLIFLIHSIFQYFPETRKFHLKIFESDTLNSYDAPDF
jgi:hypothetical protein